MIDDDKPSLSVCAFGASLAHAAALTLILPIVITLPAPADPAPRAVAIHVEIRMATPEPAFAEGNAEDIGSSLDESGSDEVTAALPSATETDEVNDATEASAVANVDADEMPAVVPVPLRRPKLTGEMEEHELVPRQHATYRQSRPPAKPVTKRILGGHPATPMPEYPTAGRLEPIPQD